MTSLKQDKQHGYPTGNSRRTNTLKKYIDIYIHSQVNSHLKYYYYQQIYLHLYFICIILHNSHSFIFCSLYRFNMRLLTFSPAKRLQRIIHNRNIVHLRTTWPSSNIVPVNSKPAINEEWTKTHHQITISWSNSLQLYE